MSASLRSPGIRTARPLLSSARSLLLLGLAVTINMHPLYAETFLAMK
jgi:hypothetical protein